MTPKVSEWELLELHDICWEDREEREGSGSASATNRAGQIAHIPVIYNMAIVALLVVCSIPGYHCD